MYIIITYCKLFLALQ
uniref:Uncharacterized protein n=1 Tax=Anguilla anguilla TaxID=7936 RepID=A0A0E9SJC2_ANGAN